MKKDSNKYHREYYASNREKMREYYRKYRAKNREKIANRMKKYHVENRDKGLARSKAFYEKNKASQTAKNRASYRTPKGRWWWYKKTARQRGIEFKLELSHIEAFWMKPCVFGCAIETIGLDRIDSDKGYVPGNIQPMCAGHNRMKGSLSDKDFFEMCSCVTNLKRSSIIEVTPKLDNSTVDSDPGVVRLASERQPEERPESQVLIHNPKSLAGQVLAEEANQVD